MVSRQELVSRTRTGAARAKYQTNVQQELIKQEQQRINELMKAEQDRIDKINEQIRKEKSAIESYETALSYVKSGRAGQLPSHLQKLGQQIQEQGITSSEGSIIRSKEKFKEIEESKESLLKLKEEGYVTTTAYGTATVDPLKIKTITTPKGETMSFESWQDIQQTKQFADLREAGYRTLGTEGSEVKDWEKVKTVITPDKQIVQLSEWDKYVEQQRKLSSPIYTTEATRTDIMERIRRGDPGLEMLEGREFSVITPISGERKKFLTPFGESILKKVKPAIKFAALPYTAQTTALYFGGKKAAPYVKKGISYIEKYKPTTTIKPYDIPKINLQFATKEDAAKIKKVGSKLLMPQTVEAKATAAVISYPFIRLKKVKPYVKPAIEFAALPYTAPTTALYFGGKKAAPYVKKGISYIEKYKPTTTIKPYDIPKINLQFATKEDAAKIKKVGSKLLMPQTVEAKATAAIVSYPFIRPKKDIEIYEPARREIKTLQERLSKATTKKEQADIEYTLRMGYGVKTITQYDPSTKSYKYLFDYPDWYKKLRPETGLFGVEKTQKETVAGFIWRRTTSTAEEAFTSIAEPTFVKVPKDVKGYEKIFLKQKYPYYEFSTPAKVTGKVGAIGMTIGALTVAPAPVTSALFLGGPIEVLATRPKSFFRYAKEEPVEVALAATYGLAKGYQIYRSFKPTVYGTGRVLPLKGTKYWKQEKPFVSAGERSWVSSPYRMKMGLKPIYKGGPAALKKLKTTDPKLYKEIMKELTRSRAWYNPARYIEGVGPGLKKTKVTEFLKIRTLPKIIGRKATKKEIELGLAIKGKILRTELKATTVKAKEAGKYIKEVKADRLGEEVAKFIKESSRGTRTTWYTSKPIVKTFRGKTIFYPTRADVPWGLKGVGVKSIEPTYVKGFSKILKLRTPEGQILTSLERGQVYRGGTPVFEKLRTYKYKGIVQTSKGKMIGLKGGKKLKDVLIYQEIGKEGKEATTRILLGKQTTRTGFVKFEPQFVKSKIELIKEAKRSTIKGTRQGIKTQVARDIKTVYTGDKAIYFREDKQGIRSISEYLIKGPKKGKIKLGDTSTREILSTKAIPKGRLELSRLSIQGGEVTVVPRLKFTRTTDIYMGGFERKGDVFMTSKSGKNYFKELYGEAKKTKLKDYPTPPKRKWSEIVAEEAKWRREARGYYQQRPELAFRGSDLQQTKVVTDISKETPILVSPLFTPTTIRTGFKISPVLKTSLIFKTLPILKSLVRTTPIQQPIYRQLQQPALKSLQRSIVKPALRLSQTPVLKTIQKPVLESIIKPEPSKPPKPPIKPIFRPFILPFKLPETTEERIRLKVKQKLKEQGYDVLARPAKTGGYIKLNKVPVTESQAKDIGAYMTDTTLSAQFKIKKSDKPAQTPKIKAPAGYYSRTKYKFRDYNIRKGKRVPMKNTWIEKKENRIDTMGEINKITLFQKLGKQTRNRRKKKK